MSATRNTWCILLAMALLNGCRRAESDFDPLTKQWVYKVVLGITLDSHDVPAGDLIDGLHTVANQRLMRLAATPISRLANLDPVSEWPRPALLIAAGQEPALLVDTGVVEQDTLAMVQDLSQRSALVLCDEIPEMWAGGSVISNVTSTRDQVHSGHIGSIATVDRPYRCLGFIPPHTTKSVQFKIQNLTSEPLVVQRVFSSCTCTVSDINKDDIISPEGVQTVALSVSHSGKQFLSEWVQVTVAGSQDVSQQLLLEVVGWSPQMLKVVPQEPVNFGAIGSESISRSVRILESNYDRFSITSVKIGELPVNHELRIKERGGMRQYVIDLAIDPKAIPTGLVGVQVNELLVETTSRWTPSVRIPVRYEVRPSIELRPSVIDFGKVSLGEVVSRSIEVRARNGSQTVNWDVPDDSPGVFELSKQGSATLVVQVSPQELGFTRSVFALKADGEPGLPGVSIKCSVLGVP